ncbi:APC family permease [Flavitalea flava]
MSDPQLKRTVTRLPAILLVVSAIVGSGIFKKIAPMSDGLRSPLWVLICWVAAGVLSLIGALCNAELAAMMPASGGEYVYFKRIYGRFFSFLYGWANLAIIRGATIAALAYIFSESFNSIYPLPELTLPLPGAIGANASVKILASVLILFLSYINHRGVVLSEKLSRYLIVSIMIVILSFVVFALLSGKGSVENFKPAGETPHGWRLLTAFFAASISAFWGYEGWNNIGFIGEEVKNPQKNIPFALGVGTLVVILLYLVVNTVYLYVLPIEQLASFRHAANKIAAVEVARVISGSGGALLLSCLILLTTFCCTNSTILMSARISFAMARDGLFLKGAGTIHPTYHTPSKAIKWQGAWSLVLLWSGSFDQLTDLLIFASFIFYGATSLGVIVLRKKDPHTIRPYRVVGYPVLPIIFTIFCLMLVVITIIQEPVSSLIGLILIFSGIPVYLYYNKTKK